MSSKGPVAYGTHMAQMWAATGTPYGRAMAKAYRQWVADLANPYKAKRGVDATAKKARS